MWQRFNSRFIGAWQPGKSQRYVWQRKISTLYSRLQLPRLRQHSPVRSRGRRFGATPSASSKSQVRPPWHRWEEHWSPVKVEEGLRSGEVLIGRLHVPSFQTDTAFVVTKLNEEDVWIPVTGFAGRNRALHGDEVAALPLWSPWRPGGATKDPPLEAPPPPPPAQELDLTALTVAQFRDAVLSHLRASEEQALPLTMLGNLEEVQNLRKGLGGLRKALQRLEEIELIEEGQPPEWIARLKVVPAPPSSSPPTVAPAPRDGGREGEQNLSRARCRVVAVMKRSPQNVGEIVAMARDIEGGAPLKAQPRDRRLPALWLLHPEISQGVASVQSELMKRDERREAAREAATVARQQSLSHEALSKALQESQKGVLCVVKFRDWPDESLSPRADLVEILGPSGTAEAERFPETVPELLAATLKEWRYVLRRLLLFAFFFVWLYTLAEHYCVQEGNIDKEVCILLAFTAPLMGVSVSQRFHRGIQMIWHTPNRWRYFQIFGFFAMLFYLVSLKAFQPQRWAELVREQPWLAWLHQAHYTIHTSVLGTFVLSCVSCLYLATASGVIFLFWKTSLRVPTVADTTVVECGPLQSDTGTVNCGLCQLGLCLDNTCM